MKRIILVRHAKSSWEFDVIDHERPLNKRGVKDAYLVSNFLNEFKLKIDSIFSSDATRAKLTANIFVSNLNINEDKVCLDHELYDFSGMNLVKFIKGTNDSVEDLMIFGHNHAITSFVNTYGSKTIDNVPTSGVTIIEFEINHWKNLTQGKTIKTIFPRDLKKP